MKTVFLKELKLTRKGLMIWCLVMLITWVYGAAEYGVVSENIENITQSMSMLPRIVVIMFGIDGVSLETSLGYHLAMFYWACLIAFLHAISVGVIMISRDQRDRTSEYLYTKPYRRKDIITSKILAGILNLWILAFVTWIASAGTLIFIEGTLGVYTNGDSVFGLITLTIIGMFLTQIVFFTMGLLFAALFPTYKAALRSGFIFVIITYALSVIIEYSGKVDFFSFLSPFRYFSGLSVVNDGIRLGYVLIAAMVAATATYMTYAFFNKKDLLI